jgi:AsmA protein
LLQAIAKKDTFEGKADLNFDLAGQGESTQQILKTLSGRGALQVRDGALRGINLARSLRDFKSQLSIHRDEAQPVSRVEKTDFTELAIAFDAQGGVATLRDLMLKSPALRATLGSPAWVDLRQPFWSTPPPVKMAKI